MILDILRENQQEVIYKQPEWQKFTTGLFVVVDLIGGLRQKIHYKCVCCIQLVDQEDGEIVVNGYRRYDELSTQFVQNENDNFAVSSEQITAILPIPELKEIDRKIVYEFPGSVAVFEK